MSEPTPVVDLADVLLALPGFVVTGAHVDDRDEVVATIELPAGGLQACPTCGEIEVHPLHARRRQELRHLPVAGRACRLVWSKRLLACVAGCGTFVERDPAISARAVLTNPARRTVVAMSADNVPVAAIARLFGVAWHTAMTPIAEAAARVPRRSPRRVGIDETVSVTGRYGRRRRVLVTSLVDLDTGLVIATGIGRNRQIAQDLLAEHAPDAEVVACDLFSGYRSAARVLDAAVVVADVFHVVRLALQVLDEVRRRRQQQTLGHRGHKHDPLYRARRALRVGQERLDAATIAWLIDLLDAGDTDGEVAAAWHAVDLVRRMYAAPDRDTAHQRLLDVYWWAADMDVPEITRLARTLATWEDEVLAFFDTRASNGPTEAANVKVKNIRRAARGFRNHDNYIARIRLHAGQPRRLPTTSRLRGPDGLTGR